MSVVAVAVVGGALIGGYASSQSSKSQAEAALAAEDRAGLSLPGVEDLLELLQ